VTINKIRIHKYCPVWLLVLLLPLLAYTAVYAAGNIDVTNKWAWGTNVGWINFNPTHGGVAVYDDHLEGYAWAENGGWIRLGAYEGGGSHTYANDAAANYGVNNDGSGNLSGYAWGAHIGWINFAPTHGGVWVDPVTGDFNGYAWGENVGWIHFQGDSPAYKVSTTWRGALLAAYQNDIAAIITTHRPAAASSGGLTIANSSFLNDAGDGIIFGHNHAAFANVTTDLPGGVDKRWARLWQLDVNDAAGNGGAVNLTFDISDAGGQGEFSETGAYFLLKRAAGSSAPFTTVTVANTGVSGDQLTFTVAAANLGSEFTLGATAGSPTAVTRQSLTARSGGWVLGGVGVSLLTLGVIAFVVARLRRDQVE